MRCHFNAYLGPRLCSLGLLCLLCTFSAMSKFFAVKQHTSLYVHARHSGFRDASKAPEFLKAVCLRRSDHSPVLHVPVAEEQICVQLPTYADNVALPAAQQPIDISCSRGPQQQTYSSGFAAVGSCWETDTVPFIDPDLHTMLAVLLTTHMSRDISASAGLVRHDQTLGNIAVCKIVNTWKITKKILKAKVAQKSEFTVCAVHLTIYSVQGVPKKIAHRTHGHNSVKS